LIYRVIRFGLIVGLLSIINLAFAQRFNCAETLNQAQQQFDDGHLYSIPSVLKPCLDNGFNKTQKIEAFLILTRTYLLIDDPISAEDSYLKLLALDPEYRIDRENDPVDIVYLDEKFTTTPIFILFGRIGLNASNASEISNYGVDNTDLTRESYNAVLGFNIGGGTELNITDNFSFGLELDFSSKAYEYKNTLFEGDLQTLIERQTSLEVPVFVKYRTHFNKIQPFVYGGISFQYLLSANAEVSLIDRYITGEGDVTEFSITGPNENLNDMRNSFNKNIIGGIGLNYRIGYSYIFVDARYSFGMNNIVKSDKQYSSRSLLYNYAFVDDFKRINTVSLSFGYIKPLYKPRKIQKGGNFFKRIFN
jgi:hypothetical protein